MAPKDPYKTLQVDPQASDVVIDAAYKALRKQRQATKEETRAWHSDLDWAYSVIGSPASRHGYDRDRRWGRLQPMGPGQGGGQSLTEPVYLDSGPYAGWLLTDVAAHDPDYLVWLSSQSIPAPLRSAVEALRRGSHPRR